MTTAFSVPATLTEDLVDRLAALSGQPDSVAEVALSALAYGSLSSLIAHGIVEDVVLDDDVHEIVITSYGRSVIDACAALRRDSASPALSRELVDRLAVLADQPSGVAEVALSALSYDSLALLVKQGIIAELDLDSDEPHEIVITDHGNTVIEACRARTNDADVELSAGRRGTAVGPVDSLVLLRETDTTTMHLGAVAVFEGSAPTITQLRAYVAARLGRIPRYRHKLAPAVPGLPFRRWVDDPDFRLEHHVREATLSAPGDSASLESLAASIFSERLDRSQPLWELWLVDGLHDGAFALISKTHYALLEDLTGTDLVTALFDLTPDRAWLESDDLWVPDASPGPVELAAASVGDGLLNAASLSLRTLGAVRSPTRAADQLRQAVRAIPRVVRAAASPPESPLSVERGRRRRVAFVGASLTDLKAVKTAFGCSMNDVVLAGVAGALHYWLQSRGADTDRLESKAVAISTRGPDEAPLATRMTQMTVPLPIDESDVVSGLRCIAEANVEEPLRPDDGEATIATQFARLAIASRRSEVIVASLIASPLPLYVLGRRLRSLSPMGFLVGDHPLSIVVLSYEDDMRFGLVADGDAVPDLDLIAYGLREALSRLIAYARGSDDMVRGNRRQAVSR